MPHCTPFASFWDVGQQFGAGVLGRCRKSSGSSNDLSSGLRLEGQCAKTPYALGEEISAVADPRHPSNEKARLAHRAHKLGTETELSCMIITM